MEDVATPEAFRRDPRLVWKFYAMRQHSLLTVEPNPAHRVLAAMEGHYQEFLLVTQNVDDLHERGGSRKLVKLHGSLMESRCARCGTVRALADPVPLAEIEAGTLPRCACGGLLRPNVVWFGERLNPLHFERMLAFFQRCPIPLSDAGPAVLLVIGTSGMVSSGYHVASLARLYGSRRVEINPNPTEISHEVDLIVRAPAGELLERIWPRVIG